jgi:hypothetical protein
MIDGSLDAAHTHANRRSLHCAIVAASLGLRRSSGWTITSCASSVRALARATHRAVSAAREQTHTHTRTHARTNTRKHTRTGAELSTALRRLDLSHNELGLSEARNGYCVSHTTPQCPSTLPYPRTTPQCSSTLPYPRTTPQCFHAAGPLIANKVLKVLFRVPCRCPRA